MYATTGYHQRTFRQCFDFRASSREIWTRWDGSQNPQLKMRIVGASTSVGLCWSIFSRSPPFTQATIAGWVFGTFLFSIIYGIIPIDFHFFSSWLLHLQPDWVHRRVRRFLGGWTIGIFWQLGPRMMWLLNEERRQNVGSFLCTGRESAGMGKQGDLERNYLAFNEDWWLPVARVALSGIKSLYICSLYTDLVLVFSVFDSIKLVPNYYAAGPFV